MVGGERAPARMAPGSGENAPSVSSLPSHAIRFNKFCQYFGSSVGNGLNGNGKPDARGELHRTVP